LTVLVNDALEKLDLVRALDEVSAERRARALRCRLDVDRRLSVAVYLLLKEALRRTYGFDGNPRLAYGPDGKPVLADHPGIHFNLSHCPKAAACVVADFPVGIDVEEVSTVNWEVANAVLSEDELSEVRASSSPEIAFARYWTRKEAFVKLSGGGLDDHRLKTLLSDLSGVVLETSEHLDRGYVLTVAGRRSKW